MSHASAQRLEALIDRRRLDRVLRWKDVSEEIGITSQTLHEARKGRPVSALTAAGIERFMGWAPGSVELVRSGDDPIPLDSPPERARPEWDGELVGPAEPLLEGEVLRWRRSGTRDALIYELTVGEVSMATGFYPHETPEDVIDELREGVEQIELRSKQRHRRVRR